jgi:flagellar FliJ protein
MRWADQLIRLATYQVELLQGRLAEITQRRDACEVRLALLTAQGEAELALARGDPEAAWRLGEFAEGLKARKAAVRREIDLAGREEQGAREALAEAFETLKKYERVADNARAAVARETSRREGAVLDEMGLRRASGR